MDLFKFLSASDDPGLVNRVVLFATGSIPKILYWHVRFDILSDHGRLCFVDNISYVNSHIGKNYFYNLTLCDGLLDNNQDNVDFNLCLFTEHSFYAQIIQRFLKTCSVNWERHLLGNTVFYLCSAVA